MQQELRILIMLIISLIILLMVFILVLLVVQTFSAAGKCAYTINQTLWPHKTDRDSFLIDGMIECSQFNGHQGCCDSGNNDQQVTNYVQIDGVFGSGIDGKGDGCDICAINLKRFWCNYACSPKQGTFLQVSQDYYPYPDPQNPSETVLAQKVILTVQATTACALFKSCARTSFVSSVSAMGTAAGFLNFLGINAANQAHQHIQMRFSYNKSLSLYFGNDEEQTEYISLDRCSLIKPSESKLHNFTYHKPCVCNNCDESCNVNGGFKYEESSILQGFDYWLVGGVWAFTLVVTIGVSLRKNRQE